MGVIFPEASPDWKTAHFYLGIQPTHLLHTDHASSVSVIAIYTNNPTLKRAGELITRIGPCPARSCKCTYNIIATYHSFYWLVHRSYGSTAANSRDTNTRRLLDRFTVRSSVWYGQANLHKYKYVFPSVHSISRFTYLFHYPCQICEAKGGLIRSHYQLFINGVPKNWPTVQEAHSFGDFVFSQSMLPLFAIGYPPSVAAVLGYQDPNN